MQTNTSALMPNCVMKPKIASFMIDVIPGSIHRSARLDGQRRAAFTQLASGFHAPVLNKRYTEHIHQGVE